MGVRRRETRTQTTMLISSEEELKSWRSSHFPVVVASGCFDVLHVGHIRLLKSARGFGNWLLVGINSDAAVESLKGFSRPINSALHRAEMLIALRVVDAVYVFDSVRATEFLRLARPSTWVKGGDYTLETLDQNERKAVEDAGGEIVIVPSTPGFSTTSTLRALHK